MQPARAAGSSATAVTISGDYCHATASQPFTDDVELTTFHVEVGGFKMRTQLPYERRPNLLALATMHGVAPTDIVGVAIVPPTHEKVNYQPLDLTNPVVLRGHHVFIKAKKPGASKLALLLLCVAVSMAN